MNINILSVEEILRYIENGVIDSVPATIMLEFVQQMKTLKEELREAEDNYSKGWDAAISEMQGALDRL